MLESRAAAEQPQIVAPVVGSRYEFGMEAHRAGVYASAIVRHVPVGVPTVVSDDPAAWRGGAGLAGRHPFVPVMHSDDEHYYSLFRRYGRAAAGVVCVSTRVARRTTPLVHGCDIPVATIPCGTRLRRCAQEPAVVDGAVRLIWVGRMVEGQKRVSDLPRIVARVRALGLDCVLDVVGEGPARGPMEEALARGGGGLADRVRFHGWLGTAEVWLRLAESDILLLPSNFEGMPVVIMEALGAGCAVVGTRISGVEDYEHHPLAEGCYWLYAVGDVEAAAQAVVTAARVPRDERRRRARSLAEAEFTIERCVERYSAFLGGLRVSPGSGSGWSGSGLRRHLVSALSVPVAAQRMARLWARGAYGAYPRPGSVSRA
jgi:glycosyltransferase involved in cell wall biosynthesis